MEIDRSYLLNTMQRLIDTPSPTGYYVKIKAVLEEIVAELGYTVSYDNRDTAYIRVEGQDPSKTVCVSSHADTLGFMVRAVNGDGTLRIRALGGINYANVEGENVTVHTRDGRTYTGMLACTHHSSHAFDDAASMARNENTVHVLLDEQVNSAEDVRALGICHGDYVSIDPRFTVTEKGFIKSRFIDDKASVACVLTALKYMKEKGLKPQYNTVFAITMYEEIGLGGVRVPEEISEYLAVDIAILGPDSDGSEQKVSICAKDASLPYDYDFTGRLIEAAKKAECDYAVDLFYRYGSDAGAAIRAGNNLRAALIGMGVYASHGVERTHITGVENTAKLVLAYLLGA
ncbi:MAG: M42 family metallopeptidase [Clostridia bacterium]|nr:M42 family metallopeptidase [Clostridia bacterium]